MSESSYKVYASEEYVDQRVPPSPDGTHKMLVTDADGKQVWEERTHWAEEKEVVIVPETTDSTQSVMGRLTALVLNNPFGTAKPFSVGQSYKVTWDGAEYETIAELAEDGAYMLQVSQGGLSYVLWLENSSPELIAAVVENGYGGTHTVMITTVEQASKKIDAKKYLPDGYPYIEVITKFLADNITVEIVDGQPASSQMDMSGIAEGQKATVTWDEVQYQCVVQMNNIEGADALCIGNMGLLSGSDGTGVPFLIANANGMTMIVANTGTHTMSVSVDVEGTVHPLDPKYLPDDHINTLIDTKLEAAHPTELITIPASAWTGTEAPYFAMNQACSIATMTNKLIVSLSPTLASDEDGLNEMLSADTYNAIAKSKLMAVVQADGAITLAAYGKKPEIDIPVIVTEVG